MFSPAPYRCETEAEGREAVCSRLCRSGQGWNLGLHAFKVDALSTDLCVPAHGAPSPAESSCWLIAELICSVEWIHRPDLEPQGERSVRPRGIK